MARSAHPHAGKFSISACITVYTGNPYLYRPQTINLDLLKTEQPAFLSHDNYESKIYHSRKRYYTPRGNSPYVRARAIPQSVKRDCRETQYNVRCRAITYASPGTIQFSCDTSHPVSEDAHPRCNAHSSDRRAHREIRRGTQVAATLIKSEEGVLYPGPSDCRQKLKQ